MQNPRIIITMEDGGEIIAELFPDVAPNTVNNFLSLARSSFYDGLIFHRVIAGFMLQGGCPLGQGIGNPGYSIKGEFAENGHNNNLPHSRGVLSMARSGAPNSAGSQFFIMHDDAPHLDGAYAAFGCVTDGLDIVDAIASVQTNYDDRPETEQKIARITVETFGREYPEPERM
jgi:peptidyl-prolyl cis-trans isomerase B (cyclophilin B)